MNTSVKIEGEREILKKMRALPGKMERKVYRGAVSRSATPILKRARSLCSSKTVRKALSKRAKNRANRGEFDQIIGVRRGVFRSKRAAKRRGKGAVYYPDEAIRFYRFLELGFSKKREGGGRTVVPAKPFLRPAIKRADGEASSTLSKEIDKGLAKVVNG